MLSQDRVELELVVLLALGQRAQDQGAGQTEGAAFELSRAGSGNHDRALRDHTAAHLVAGADEVAQLAPIAINETVREGDLIADALRVIHLPGKSAGEIGLYFDPVQHAVSRKMNGILLLGHAIIGNPPGALSLIPESKLDDSSKLKRSLRKLLDYDFDVLLLCDGQPVLSGGKLKVAEFLNALGG